jgi:ferritin
MLKFIRYINERGGHAIVSALKQPKKEFTAVKKMFEEVMKHEQFISASINDIVALCIAERDYTTQHWLQWFVNEQIEEEANVTKILDKLNLIGDNNLYMFDRDILSLRAAASAKDAEAEG